MQPEKSRQPLLTEEIKLNNSSEEKQKDESRSLIRKLIVVIKKNDLSLIQK